MNALERVRFMRGAFSAAAVSWFQAYREKVSRGLHAPRFSLVIFHNFLPALPAPVFPGPAVLWDLTHGNPNSRGFGARSAPCRAAPGASPSNRRRLPILPRRGLPSPGPPLSGPIWSPPGGENPPQGRAFPTKPEGRAGFLCAILPTPLPRNPFF